MKDVSLETAPTTKSGADADLIGRARAVLEANWLGHGTSPSLQLYPHQWSWDAACIAMGYASWYQSRAEQELRSLFAGQWRNGLLPHIVFTEGASYFPGPRLLGDRALAGGSRAASDLRHRPASDPRDGCVAGVRPRSRPAAGDGVSRRALPAAPVVARVPLSRTLPKRGRPRRDLAPVGVGDGQLPAVGRGARAHVAEPGDHPGVRARRRASRGCSGAPVRCRIRSLRLSGRPVPGACLRALADPRRGALRSPAGALQLAPRPLQRGSCPHRARPRLGRRSVRGVGREHRSRPGKPVGRRAGAVHGQRRHRREAGGRRDGGRPRAAVRGRARPAVGRSAWSTDSRTPALPSETLVGS